MDPADLLDYALERLDGPRRERIERQIAGDPALARRVARLIRNLDRLLDDGRRRCPTAGTPSFQTDPISSIGQGSDSRVRPAEDGNGSTGLPHR